MVIAPSARRRHLGSWLLKNYVTTIRNTQKNVKLVSSSRYILKTSEVSYNLRSVGIAYFEKILLICKHHLIPFYKTCGFQLVGESAVVHGKEKWFEMKS